MRICELFRSLQGEGRLRGTPSVFIRASGCNLRCWYCDTPYASWEPEGEDLAVEEIVGRAAALGTEHIVLTGGEPMLFAELVPLTAALKELGRHLTIETSGTLYLPVVCDLMSISPKLSNSTPPAEEGEPGRSDQADAGLASAEPSLPVTGRPIAGQHTNWRERHERNRHVPSVIRRLAAEYDYQLKFVIDRPDDCREVDEYLAEFPEIARDRVMLMPQGIDAAVLAEKAAWLEPYCRQHGLVFCPRSQIEWFGSTRGT